MGIDFHDQQNIHTYATRTVDSSWMEAIQKLILPEHQMLAADIGCGGGIYSKALVELGVDRVHGIDYSTVSLESAKKYCRDQPAISFFKGEALHTERPDNLYTFVLQRALIHHLEDQTACFKEANRIMKKGGRLCVQDRTPDDCFLPGSPSHIRGYLFECFPHLREVERQRRPDQEQVMIAMEQAGFHHVQQVKVWETRKRYLNKQELLEDVKRRTGRSILHHLTDEELEILIAFMSERVLDHTPIVEEDRWTIWHGTK